MFSVVIPLYNKCAHIEKCIQSVLDQTYKNFELIIVNDGSIDDGAELAGSFKDCRIRLIDEQNAGVSTARNNGVDATKYNYIALLDADDWWDEHFLERMKQLIDQFPDAGIWGCNYYYVKNGINRLENKGFEKGFTAGYIDYFRVYASSFCVPFNCSFIVVNKQDFSSSGGFNPSLKFGEDFDLWLRIALRSKIAYLNQPLSFSNQDVEISTRALGSRKYYKKEEHFIFNLDHIAEKENQVPDLKKLLDGLRVRNLLVYYLANYLPNDVKKELDKVDFAKQSLYYHILYACPKSIARVYFKGRQFGSFVKQNILNYLSPKITFHN
jgi:glycosyltransferase involved in cell wall biosynthesis